MRPRLAQMSAQARFPAPPRTPAAMPTGPLHRAGGLPVREDLAAIPWHTGRRKAAGARVATAPDFVATAPRHRIRLLFPHPEGPVISSEAPGSSKLRPLQRVVRVSIVTEMRGQGEAPVPGAAPCALQISHHLTNALGSRLESGDGVKVVDDDAQRPLDDAKGHAALGDCAVLDVARKVKWRHDEVRDENVAYP